MEIAIEVRNKRMHPWLLQRVYLATDIFSIQYFDVSRFNNIWLVIEDGFAAVGLVIAANVDRSVVPQVQKWLIHFQFLSAGNQRSMSPLLSTLARERGRLDVESLRRTELALIVAWA